MRDADARLVERARAGEASAFEELVRRHLRAAYAVALAVLREPADAEDVCQDAFLTALERLEECRRPDRFAAWLLQIVRNRALNLRRAQTVRWALPLEDVVGVAGRHDTGHQAERSELRARLLAAMEDLSEPQREALLLHDLEGWRHREVAAHLGVPESTARAYLFQARRRLRARLGAELMEEG